MFDSVDLDVIVVRVEVEWCDIGMCWMDLCNGVGGIVIFVDCIGNFLIFVGFVGLVVGGVGVLVVV